MLVLAASVVGGVVLVATDDGPTRDHIDAIREDNAKKARDAERHDLEQMCAAARDAGAEDACR